MTYRPITLSLPEDLYLRIKAHPDINWSKVAQSAFRETLLNPPAAPVYRSALVRQLLLAHPNMKKVDIAAEVGCAPSHVTMVAKKLQGMA